MKRREFLIGLGGAALALSQAEYSGAARFYGYRESETPEEIYARSLSIDAMCFGGAPPRGYVPYLTEDKVEALRVSGITALSMNMTSGESGFRTVDNMFLAVQDRIREWDLFVSKNSDVFQKVRNSAELMEVKRSGKVGFIYNFQMASPLGWDLSRLDKFYEMGVRQIQLCGGRRNYLVDSCWEPTNAGMSKFGYEVIDAFNEKGVIVDLAHVGDESAYDAIKASKEPVINSHSGCLALCPHPRNATDRNIKAMADKGGVFCVYNQSGWLTKDPVITMDHYIAHIDHIIKIAGEDHVAMGTDQDAVDMTAMRPNEVFNHNEGFKRRRKDYPQLDWEVKHMRVPELSHPKRLLHLTQALHKRGYKTRTIEKIIGLNYARVFKEVSG
jgi:membrane dipeptidase